MPSPAARRAVLNLSDLPKVEAMRGEDCVVAGPISMNGSGNLELVAEAIRRQSTGIHAKVTLTIDGTQAAYNTFNVERLADREELARRAGETMGMDKDHVSHLKQHVHGFCSQVWATWIDGGCSTDIAPDASYQPSWMLDPFILGGRTGTILFGPPGIAKSWLGIMWTQGIRYGGLPWSAQQGETLFCNLERDPKSLAWRVDRVNRMLGVSGSMRAWSGRGATLYDAIEPLRKDVKRHGVQLVVVDSLSRAGTGDLNANDAMNRAMDSLNSLGCAWVVIGHTPRGDDTHVYGSVMSDAAADITVRMTAQQADDAPTMGIALEVRKINDGKRAPQQVWAMEFDDRGPTTFRRAEEGEFSELLPAKRSASLEIDRYLRQVGTATAKDIATETGIEDATVRQALNRERDRRFVVVEQGKGRASTIWGIAAPASLTQTNVGPGTID